MTCLRKSLLVNAKTGSLQEKRTPLVNSVINNELLANGIRSGEM
jgi:hypothetical protein